MEIDHALKEKAHYVAVTGIIQKNGRYLICKRSEKEKAFPGKWCVPGGKIEQNDFIHEPKDTSQHWLNIFEKVLRREIKEETGLSIKDIGYVSSLAFLRQNGFSTIVVSLYAAYDAGLVELNKEELVDYRWVTLAEAQQYDLIENIYEQLEQVDRIMTRHRKNT